MSAPYRGIHLRLEHWPDRDREVWEALFVHGDLFDGTGAACHWAVQTRTTNFQHYARWLGWLSTTGELDPELEPWHRATPARVEAYARSLLRRCAPRTVASALIGLKCVLQRMHPEGDWRWLKDLTNRLDAWAQPAIDRRAEVLSAKFQTALGELERLAGRQPMTRRDQIAFRDVLIVALLATCPVRMRNLLQIEVGQHLLRRGDQWELLFGADETKTRQPLRYLVAVELGPWLDFYLDEVQPGFRTEPGCRRLWPGSKGRPLAYESLYSSIKRTTNRLFGVPVTPHCFRSIAATALAEASPEHALFARPLLGHRLPETTERHYVKAGQLEASCRVNAVLRAARDMSAAPAAPAADSGAGIDL